MAQRCSGAVSQENGRKKNGENGGGAGGETGQRAHVAPFAKCVGSLMPSWPRGGCWLGRCCAPPPPTFVLIPVPRATGVAPPKFCAFPWRSVPHPVHLTRTLGRGGGCDCACSGWPPGASGAYRPLANLPLSFPVTSLPSSGVVRTGLSPDALTLRAAHTNFSTLPGGGGGGEGKHPPVAAANPSDLPVTVNHCMSLTIVRVEEVRKHQNVDAIGG